MSDPVRHDCSLLVLEHAIDKICDDFEAEWRQGKRPRLEDYLDKMDGPAQSELLRALLAVELEYRYKAKELPSAEEYWDRLPGFVLVIADVIEKTPPPGPRPTTAEAALADLASDDPIGISFLYPLPAREQGPGPTTSPPRPRPMTALRAIPDRSGDDLAETITYPDPLPPREQGAGHPEQDPSFPCVPGYQILGVLHEGGMGVVYTARQQSLPRVVALKMIRRQWAAAAEFRARFRKEAKAVAGLTHPNIVQVHEFGEHDGQLWFTMEFVAGGSLKQKLADTPLAPRQAAEVVEKLARAMQLVHQTGVIHRDLKPGNILLSFKPATSASGSGTTGAPAAAIDPSQWEPKIADFGLAKRVDLPEGLTHTGQIVGTPPYMAPEQAAGNAAEVDAVSDVYGLGAILYETLTGQPPFRGDTLLQTLYQVRNDDPVRPSRLRRNLPRDLETICLKCLEKDRGKRYQSAAELADRLRLFLDGKPIPDRPTSAGERAVKWCRRRPALAAFLAASSLALVLLVSNTVAVLWTLSAEAEIAERELNRWKQAEDTRKTISELLGATRGLLKEGKWPRAEGELNGAVKLLQAEERLRAEFAAEFSELRKAIRAAKEKEQRRDESRMKYEQFKALLDQALFHASAAGSLEAPGSLPTARKAAREALHIFGMDRDGAVAPDLNPAHFAKRKMEEIAIDCYFLLLTLAEATAQRLPGERERTTEAMRLLDRAAQMPMGETPAYHLSRARCLTALGRTDDAKRERQAAKDGQSSTAADHFLLGNLACHENRLQGALEHYKDALNKQPQHFWGNFSVAVCAFRLGRFELAESHLTVCQGLKNDFAWVYILRGFVRGGLGAKTRVRGAAAKHFVAADADFQQAEALLKERPDREATYVLLVNRGVVRTLHRDYDRAIADLKKAIEIDGDFFHAYWALAKAYHDRDRDRFLLQQFRRLLAATPLCPLPCLLRPPKYEEALAHVNRAIERHPDLASLYLYRGRLRLEREEASQAVEDFDKVIRLYCGLTLNPREEGELADAYLERGRHLYRRKQNNNALQAFEDAQTLRPGLRSVHRHRADVLATLGQYAEAVDAYDAYLATGGNPVLRVFEGRGLCRHKLEDHKGAIADFTEALKLKPPPEDRVRLHVQRGWSHLRRQALDKAEKDFEKALGLDPRSADAHAGLGFVWIRRDRQKAFAHAQAALDRESKGWAISFKAAHIFTQLARLIPERPGNLRHANERERYVALALERLQFVLAQAPDRDRARLWPEINSNLRAVLNGPRFDALTRTYPQLPEK